MAKRKLSDSGKLQRIQKILHNILADIVSSKKTPEVLDCIKMDITQALAVCLSDHDDDMIISKKWVELEKDITQNRARFFGYRQLTLDDKMEDKPK